MQFRGFWMSLWYVHSNIDSTCSLLYEDECNLIETAKFIVNFLFLYRISMVLTGMALQ